MLSVEKLPGQLCGGPVGLKLFPLQVLVQEGEEAPLALALVQEARVQEARARVWGPMVDPAEGEEAPLATLATVNLVNVEAPLATLATVNLVNIEAWALVPMVLLGAAGDMALVLALLAGPPRNLTIPNGVADAEDPVQPASCHSSRHCPRALALPHLTEAPRLPEAEEIPWAQAKATWYFSSGVLLATRPNSALDRFAAPKHVIH